MLILSVVRCNLAFFEQKWGQLGIFTANYNMCMKMAAFSRVIRFGDGLLFVIILSVAGATVIFLLGWEGELGASREHRNVGINIFLFRMVQSYKQKMNPHRKNQITLLNAVIFIPML